MQSAVLNVLNSGFVQIALPIVVTIFIALWSQNKRFDDMNKRFDDIGKRLDKIEAKLEEIEKILHSYSERLLKLEFSKWGN